MPDQPDNAAAAALNGLVVGSTTLASGANLFVGPARPQGQGVPLGPAVFVLATGGLPPQPYLGVDFELRTETVQVTVRARPERYADGLALARGVYETLVSSSPAGFIDLQPRESAPTYLGADANGCHLFTINCEARVVRAT